MKEYIELGINRNYLDGFYEGEEGIRILCGSA
jgi:hypothetical protein